jgi:hypothetical protein
MRFVVVGADKVTGRARVLVVTAANTDHAGEKAAEAGLMVSSVDVAPDNSRGMRTAAFLHSVSVALYVLAAVAAVAGVGLPIIWSLQAEDAVGVEWMALALISAFMLWLVGVLFLALHAILTAQLDVARNTSDAAHHTRA